MLRPAVVESVRRGWTVVAVARSRPDLARLAAALGPRLLPVALDVGDAEAVDRAPTATVLRDGVDDALVYDSFDDDAAGNAALDRLAPLVTGTIVRILTSRWFPAGAAIGGSAPDSGPLPACTAAGRWPRRPRRVHLLLGVEQIGPDAGWHSPEQISAAAMAALDARRDAVLGGPPA